MMNCQLLTHKIEKLETDLATERELRLEAERVSAALDKGRTYWKKQAAIHKAECDAAKAALKNLQRA